MRDEGRGDRRAERTDAVSRYDLTTGDVTVSAELTHGGQPLRDDSIRTNVDPEEAPRPMRVALA
jgi:hypothetical protein